MPTIYDNIKEYLLPGLTDALSAARRGDFCVGYFNLRGWRMLADSVENIKPAPGEPACRLIVGMHSVGDDAVRKIYGGGGEITQGQVLALKRKFAKSLKKQLELGLPSAGDEKGLRALRAQLLGGKVKVKFFGRHSLHAKLYLAHRDSKPRPITAFVGSSNLTFSGMHNQGELNVDVRDKDTAKKLADWFEERWADDWCLDISDELAAILDESWAGRDVLPFEIYIKTAYELSREAIEGAGRFSVPAVFRGEMLDFQKQAVSLAAQRLHKRRGVMISDVVGLGKTLVASAVAKHFQDSQGGNVLVICPPKLEEMWKSYLRRYEIGGDTMSIGQTAKLKEERHYRLVVIDESHNLRNRESKRHAHVRKYLHEHESHLILLTATPFNREFADIGSQLRLFINETEDMGIRPEKYIAACRGISGFRSKHPNAMPSSLAAFERSPEADDWRDLMRMFMVRRTRSHIKKNYADYDETRGRHYLTFPDGKKRFYFPERRAKKAGFEMREDDKTDQYAMLYSADIAEGVIGELALPRYGLGGYLREQLPGDIDDEEEQTIKNLNRAGKRLVGFARSNLFKRLESCGPAFLLSVRRHIIRNAVYLAAFDDADGKLPVGKTIDIDIDIDDADENEEVVPRPDGGGANELDELLRAGAATYRAISASDARGDYRWVRTNLFDGALRARLLDDCKTLMRVFAKVKEWRAGEDRKLDALYELCAQKHGGEKILVFTQFADTADYLHDELQKRGMTNIAKITGGDDAQRMQDAVRRFSPKANGGRGGANDLRVLIATDALSEGQNLQDARIIVNFDLPWAIVRLIQRAGRIDRIGQEADEILCYCFLPEDGVENIISLRERLQNRIAANAELVGSDEKFFEGNTVNLRHVYNETLSLESEGEDDTDLISRCYDIWRGATKDNPVLQERIEKMANVVYSAKLAAGAQKPGALAYIKTADNRHILVQIGDNGEVLSQSQSAILKMMECAPEEPRQTPPANHHQSVRAAAKYAEQSAGTGIGGQLGGAKEIRRILHTRLNWLAIQQHGTLIENTNLKKLVQAVYNQPLQPQAKVMIAAKLRTDIKDGELARLAVRMHSGGELLIPVARTGGEKGAEVICSMALTE